MSIALSHENFEKIFGKRKTGVTGKYVTDKKTGKCIRVSDKARLPENVAFHEAGYDMGMGEYVFSARHKRELMKKKGLRIKEKGESRVLAEKRLKQKKESKENLRRIIANAIT